MARFWLTPSDCNGIRNDNMRDNNVIELNSARDRLRNRPSRTRDDKRMHARIESDDRLFVQVVLSAADPDLVGATVSCTAINLSVGGIQFRTDTAIPTGALLDLWVDIKSRPGKFFLAGEVRWTRPASDPDGSGRAGWLVGVQLKSGAATDIIDWREHHAQASVR